jgi:hypothetical protein
MVIPDLPEIIDLRKYGLFMSEDECYTTGFPGENPAVPLFLATVEGTERFVENEEIIFFFKNAGKVKAF